MKIWGFVGCGNLAQALIRGALSTGTLKPGEILATNRSPDKLEKFKKETGIGACSDNVELLKKADVIVLATKPQDLCEILGVLSSGITEKHLVISLAAGVPEEILQKHLGKASGLFRVMANTPAMIQKGLFGIYKIKGTSEESYKIYEFFEKIGTVAPLKSDKEINAMTAGASSGTGFVLLFMEEFEKWFVKKGFTRAQARAVTVETFLGAASLAQKRHDQPLKALREAVTSKKGTTYAGLTSMKKSKVSEALQKALEAAYDRSLGLSKNLRPNRK